MRWLFVVVPARTYLRMQMSGGRLAGIAIVLTGLLTGGCEGALVGWASGDASRGSDIGAVVGSLMATGYALHVGAVALVARHRGIRLEDVAGPCPKKRGLPHAHKQSSRRRTRLG